MFHDTSRDTMFNRDRAFQAQSEAALRRSVRRLSRSVASISLFGGLAVTDSSSNVSAVGMVPSLCSYSAYEVTQQPSTILTEAWSGVFRVDPPKKFDGVPGTQYCFPLAISSISPSRAGADGTDVFPYS